VIRPIVAAFKAQPFAGGAGEIVDHGSLPSATMSRALRPALVFGFSKL
jgi:hypothetical protein